MAALHSVGLEKMRLIIENNEPRFDYPLALMAKDVETLRYLHEKGINVNPAAAERKGKQAVIVYAAKKLDREMTIFCKSFPVSSKDIKDAISAAVNSGINRAVSPFEIVKILQEGCPRDEMRILSVGVTGLFVAAPEYYARNHHINISKVEQTLSGVLKTMELLATGKSD